MNYKFNANGKTVRVRVWDDDFHNNVTIFEENKSCDRTIKTDKITGEKFFTWNKQKIYLKDYLRYTMKELKEKIENGKTVIPDDLCQAIMNDGIENVRLICPLNPISIVMPIVGITVGLCDGGKTINTECKITEKRYTVKDHYKIGVVPVDEGAMVGSDEYYVDDMLHLIYEGRIKIIA